ncbi:hypothetical protein B1813_08930 [Saccharomonospora piscinae]|uniref:Secreted protein n=1 Tax=Saccharomonospora piscinae TaxID=687388 RepID=A0A1V9A5H6_SACPI|nr:hypothetical protein [Saccharomonospora piscinae]OQO92333.1 hypothetical protein B1813_08930 [Saccharomonospora piscinae]
MGLRKVRRLTGLVGATVAAAALTVAAPGTAAADGAYGYEVDYGTSVSTPGNALCTFNATVQVCFQPYGDKIYLKDKLADGRSAVAVWENQIVSGNLYRHGECRNTRGAGTWVVCNKNYYEGSILLIKAGTRDLSGDGSYSAEIPTYSEIA